MRGLPPGRPPVVLQLLGMLGSTTEYATIDSPETIYEQAIKLTFTQEDGLPWTNTAAREAGIRQFNQAAINQGRLGEAQQEVPSTA